MADKMHGDFESSRAELPRLAKPVRIDSVAAGWDIKSMHSGWMVNQFEVKSSAGSLSAAAAFMIRAAIAST